MPHKNALLPLLAALALAPLAPEPSKAKAADFADFPAYGGGWLKITNDPQAGGAYSNPSYLDRLGSDNDFYLFNRGTNESKILSPALVGELGYTAGSELIFYIQSNEGTFYSGISSRNPDGLSHAITTQLSPGSYYVSFEDQYNLGDNSFGNAAFTVTSEVPGPLPLLGILSAIGCTRRLKALSKRRQTASSTTPNTVSFGSSNHRAG